MKKLTAVFICAVLILSFTSCGKSKKYKKIGDTPILTSDTAQTDESTEESTEPLTEEPTEDATQEQEEEESTTAPARPVIGPSRVPRPSVTTTTAPVPTSSEPSSARPEEPEQSSAQPEEPTSAQTPEPSAPENNE